MVKFNVEFLEDDAANPVLAAGATVTKEAKHCKWSIADVVKHQLEFYMALHHASWEDSRTSKGERTMKVKSCC
jgi:hypothetical protein